LRQLSVSLEIDRGLVMLSDVLCPFSLCGGDLREKNTIPGPVHSNLRWGHGKGTVANDFFKIPFLFNLVEDELCCGRDFSYQITQGKQRDRPCVPFWLRGVGEVPGRMTPVAKPHESLAIF
jgi:hypothetical protein